MNPDNRNHHHKVVDAVDAWLKEGCMEMVHLVSDNYHAKYSPPSLQVEIIPYTLTDLPRCVVLEERKRPELGLNYCNRKRGR